MKKTLSLIALASMMPLDSRGDASGPSRQETARIALRARLRAHPKLKVMSLTELDWKQATAASRRNDPSFMGAFPYGFWLRCRVDEGIAELTRFRRDCRQDPRMKFLLPVFELVNDGWKVASPDDDPPHVDLILLGPVRS